MVKARRVGPASPRERYREWLVQLESLYGSVPGSSFAAEISDVDAGRPIHCHAYEVDLVPSNDRIEIDADGAITALHGRDTSRTEPDV